MSVIARAFVAAHADSPFLLKIVGPSVQRTARNPNTSAASAATSTPACHAWIALVHLEVPTMQHAPSVPCLLQSNRQPLPKKTQRDNERRMTVNVVAAPMHLVLPHSPQLSCASPLSVSPIHSLLPTPNGSPYSTPRGRGPFSPSTSPIPVRPGQPGYMSRSTGQLPIAPFPSLLTRSPSSASESSCQAAGSEKGCQGRKGFEVRDFPLGMTVFDPANPSLRSQLLAALGASAQSTFEAMRGFHGGMNEGTSAANGV